MLQQASKPAAEINKQSVAASASTQNQQGKQQPVPNLGMAGMQERLVVSNSKASKGMACPGKHSKVGFSLQGVTCHGDSSRSNGRLLQITKPRCASICSASWCVYEQKLQTASCASHVCTYTQTQLESELGCAWLEVLQTIKPRCASICIISGCVHGQLWSKVTDCHLCQSGVHIHRRAARVRAKLCIA